MCVVKILLACVKAKIALHKIKQVVTIAIGEREQTTI